jgi:hypothetical protein
MNGMNGMNAKAFILFILAILSKWPGQFKRFLGVPIDGDREAWLKAREHGAFLRLRPIKRGA